MCEFAHTNDKFLFTFNKTFVIKTAQAITGSPSQVNFRIRLLLFFFITPTRQHIQDNQYNTMLSTFSLLAVSMKPMWVCLLVVRSRPPTEYWWAGLVTLCLSVGGQGRRLTANCRPAWEFFDQLSSLLYWLHITCWLPGWLCHSLSQQLSGLLLSAQCDFWTAIVQSLLTTRMHANQQLPYFAEARRTWLLTRAISSQFCGH